MTTMITIALSSEELKLEPGGTTQLTVAVTNTGSNPDRFQLEIEGLDLDFYAVPVPAFTVEPGAERKERIIIKPPKTPSSMAGAYPFIVRIRSLETGDTQVAQATLIVNPFHLLTIEIMPKRGTATVFNRIVEYELAVSNMGNTDLTLQLFASDSDDACSYEFEHERLTLKPGEEKSVLIHVEPGTPVFLGATKGYSFNVSARAVDNPYVSASTQAQVVRRAFITPATLIAMFILAAMAVVYFVARPKQVVITNFSVSETKVTQGTPLTITWATKYAAELRIETDKGELIQQQLERSGKLELPAEKNIALVLVASNSLGEVKSQPITITVTKPPEPKGPEIVSFTADRTEVSKGEVVTLSWKVNNAEQVFISPLVIEPIGSVTSYQVTPQISTTYTLIAIGKKTTQRVEKSLKIIVSNAVVKKFTQNPGANPGEFVLSWEVENAVKVTITPSPGMVDNRNGETVVKPSKTTTYILTATDIDGGTVTRKLQIYIAPPPPPKPIDTEETTDNTSQPVKTD